MDIEHIKEVLRGLYIEDNPYRVWAWILTASALLWFPRGTRRTGAIVFCVVAGSMGLYFGLMAAFRSFMPDPIEEPKQKRAAISAPDPFGPRV